MELSYRVSTERVDVSISSHLERLERVCLFRRTFLHGGHVLREENVRRVKPGQK